MIPALLGILKAGGAYVPLEPSFPNARIHWILDSLQVRHLVTQRKLLPTLASAGPGATLQHVICLDRLEQEDGQEDARSHPLNASLRIWTWEHLERQPQGNLPPRARPED